MSMVQKDSVGQGLWRREWQYVQRVVLPQIPTLQFSQGAQLCGTGLSPTVDTRAEVRDLGPTLPGSLEVGHEADIKEAMYLLFVK